jgi:heptosyltransferase I
MKKILIIKTSSLGDVIHALPALTDAKQNIADITFDWVVEENFAEIPKLHSAVNNIIPVAIRRWRKHLITSIKNHEISKFRSKLKANKYDYIIDAQGLIKSGFITFMANGIRCGMDKNSARESLAAMFYQRKYLVPKNQHAITRIRQLFAAILDYHLPTNAPNYGIKAAGFNLPIKYANYLVFVHATSRDDKLWPEAYWIALAQLAQANGFKALLPWGSGVEKERALRIAANSSNSVVLPKTNLTEIADILSQAKAVVAVDTGLGHLAAALDKPLISLYGPTDPFLIGSVGQNCCYLSLTAQPEEVWQKLQTSI